MVVPIHFISLVIVLHIMIKQKFSGKRKKSKNLTKDSKKQKNIIHCICMTIRTNLPINYLIFFFHLVSGFSRNIFFFWRLYICIKVECHIYRVMLLNCEWSLHGCFIFNLLFLRAGFLRYCFMLVSITLFS